MSFKVQTKSGYTDNIKIIQEYTKKWHPSPTDSEYIRVVPIYLLTAVLWKIQKARIFIPIERRGFQIEFRMIPR